MDKPKKSILSSQVDRVLRGMKVPEKRLMTTGELGLRLGLSPRQIRDHIRLGNIRTVFIGVRHRISEEEFFRITEKGLPQISYEQQHYGKKRQPK